MPTTTARSIAPKLRNESNPLAAAIRRLWLHLLAVHASRRRARRTEAADGEFAHVPSREARGSRNVSQTWWHHGRRSESPDGRSTYRSVAPCARPAGSVGNNWAR